MSANPESKQANRSRVAVILRSPTPETGGEVYLRQVAGALSGQFDVAPVLVAGTRRAQQWWACRKLISGYDVWIEDPVSFAALRRHVTGKRILLVHHRSRVNLQDWTFGIGLNWLLERNLPRADRIVVVSKYWEARFRERGTLPIRVVYNGFDIPSYELDAFDEAAFRRRLGLDERPIVYLGHRRREKGVPGVVARLGRHRNLQLVTSGQNLVPVETHHVNPDPLDYLRLLKLSAVTVQMPEYPEGWNRLAHESMLLGTPVVSNGSGGMGELMVGAGQPVSSGMAEMEDRVLGIVGSGERVDDEAAAFLKSFSMERFAGAWTGLLKELSV